MSARRHARGPWLAGVRDLDDVVGGRPLRDRPAARWFDDEEPPAGPAPRSHREGWNRHVVGAPDGTDRGRGRRSGRAA